MTTRTRAANGARSWLTSLARDTRGNTLAIVGASLIPLAGMVGGGVDISRMYIVKTRLQHACDAGALAGRKQMGGGTWAFNSNAAEGAANRFFDANIQASPYGAASVTKTFTESAGKVSGTATATLPMTVMRVFGKTTETLTVACDAEMRLPNTDVMFVLDTTGSMNDTPSGDSQNKMASLKEAVKCFYEIVARLDTDATCTNGAPSGGTGTQVQIRFGFVPYATNVNVGRLLPTAYFADSWQYQTRKPNYTTTNVTTYPTYTDSTGPSGTETGVWSGYTNHSGPYFLACPALPANTSVGPTTTTTNTTPTLVNGNMVYYTETRYGTVETQYQCSGGFFPYIQKRTRTTGTYTSVMHTAPPVTQTTQAFSNWNYGFLSQNIAGLKNGTSWNNSVTLPVGANGTDVAIAWDGCIEERQTVKQASYTPIPSGAKDLNIDLIPTSADATTQWGPALHGLIFTRNGSGSWNTAPSPSTSADYGNQSSYQCPTEARKLQTWPTAALFEDYVDSLSPSGNTYHDIGLIWGARFASATGLFASENAFTPQGGEIERHIIFMTDGDTCTSDSNYQAYGVAWFDRRQTDAASAPTDGCTDTGTLTEQVNARTAALCTAIKNKNITLWVITFGTLATTTNTRMTACATSGRYFNATNAATLQNTFKSIADQISQLRLTR